MKRKQFPLQAQGKPGFVRVLSAETLPNGQGCLTIPCEDYTELKTLPQVLDFEGDLYSRTGWNSDHLIAYYKTDQRDLARVWRL